MKIVLNGAWRELPAPAAGQPAPAAVSAAASAAPPTLEALLGQLGFGNAVVATALNGEFVPVRSRAQIVVHDGDRIEVLSPMQGG